MQLPLPPAANGAAPQLGSHPLCSRPEIGRGDQAACAIRCTDSFAGGWLIWYACPIEVPNHSVSTPQLRGGRQAVRLLVILFLLCVTVRAQSSALSAPGESHRSPDHCCLLCHVGPLPFLQTTVSAAWAPVFQVVWLASSAIFETISDIRLVPCPSRAPPVV